MTAGAHESHGRGGLSAAPACPQVQPPDMAVRRTGGAAAGAQGGLDPGVGRELLVDVIGITAR
jgi:hypothetical protein